MMPKADTLLLVEDDDDLRESLAELVGLHGYQVVAVANGREALARLENGLAPCLILLDLMLPDLNGWEFRERQLANPEWSEIPVLIMSGADDLASESAGLQPVAFVAKPVDFDLLFKTIARYC